MDQILWTLFESYQHFKASEALSKKKSLVTSLGQYPGSLIISCSDSRVDPALIFGLDPGEVFSVRNIANLVPPYESDEGYHGTSAALEFGVCSLKVRHLVVLGHSQCGGISTLFQGESTAPSYPASKNSGFMQKWVSLLHPVRDYTETHYGHCTPSDKVLICTQLAVLASLKNLLTFPWIVDALTRETLSLHGWFFDIPTQSVLYYNGVLKKFMPLAWPFSSPTLSDLEEEGLLNLET